MNPSCVFRSVELEKKLQIYIEWYCALEEVIHDGKDSDKSLLELKRYFLNCLNRKEISNYLAFNRPLILPICILCKMLDEAHSVARH